MVSYFKDSIIHEKLFMEQIANNLLTCMTCVSLISSPSIGVVWKNKKDLFSCLVWYCINNGRIKIATITMVQTAPPKTKKICLETFLLWFLHPLWFASFWTDESLKVVLGYTVLLSSSSLITFIFTQLQWAKNCVPNAN